MSRCVVYNSGMEFANSWSDGSELVPAVRLARRADARSITHLLRRGSYSHLHADWHYPADWLGSDGFVVLDALQPEQALASSAPTLFRKQFELEACLAVAADPPPAAWVRVAALADSQMAEQKMSVLFAAAIDSLKKEHLTQIYWLLIESWPDALLRALGFSQTNFVETYVKRDMEMPPIEKMPQLIIRPVQDRDMPQLEQIERDAFEPLWRHSANSLRLAWRHALSFDVAEMAGEVIGFQLSSPAESGAHLARMTIAPSWQGSGIGTQLLAHACIHYRQLGLSQISLNTQADNVASQKLYKRFGFKPNGQQFPIWVVDL